VSTVEHPPGQVAEPAVDYDSAHEAEHPRDALYLKVALALFVLTGMEVYSSYADWLGDAFLPVLLILMTVKFVLVVLFFMHLKFDAKIFGRLFWAGFFLAVTVYCTALATFHFFAS
jgi:cytochrome c oxidase subunit IV